MLYLRWIGWAAVLLGLSVVSGAFGAHVLEKHFDDYRMAIFHKALNYQVMHSFAIMLVSMLAPMEILSIANSHRICLVFLVGIILFSGSLYLLAFTNNRWYGAFTPLGGIAFILGWVLLAKDIFGSI